MIKSDPAATVAPRIIDQNRMFDFACELNHVADTDPAAAEAFSKVIEDAMMALHRTRKYSTMIVETNEVAVPDRPLKIEVEGPGNGYGTISLSAESGYGLANLNLTLGDAKKLQRELGKAIRELNVFLTHSSSQDE